MTLSLRRSASGETLQDFLISKSGVTDQLETLSGFPAHARTVSGANPRKMPKAPRAGLHRDLSGAPARNFVAAM